MTGREEALVTSAEMAEETGEITRQILETLTGAQAAGVDPRAVPGLTASANALDPGTARPYSAGTQQDRHPGDGFASDADFLEAVHDAETAIRERAREVGHLQEETVAALDTASEDQDDAREEMQAAAAMPVKDDCDGCHDARETAIAAAQARIDDAARRIVLCETAAEILDPLADRLAAATAAIRQVPADLGETYELVYSFICGGGKMPRAGRWIEGAA
jgi:uncharacterized Ntn-hydrolase superfamily protein